MTEMNPLDQHVCRSEQVMPFRQAELGGIVADTAKDACAVGNPCADTLNQLEFTEVLEFQICGS